MSSSSSETLRLSDAEVRTIVRDLYRMSQEPGANESAVLDMAYRLISEHRSAWSLRPPRMGPGWSGPGLDLSSKPRDLPIPYHLLPK